MPRQKHQKKLNIIEDTKISINSIIQKFMAATDQREFKFSTSYTIDDRAYIHNLVIKLGLKSKSHGHGINRSLTIYKPNSLTKNHTGNVIKLQNSSIQLISNSIENFPLSNVEYKSLLPLTKRRNANQSQAIRQSNKSKKSLNKIAPQIPKLKINSDILNFRQSLNIMSKREEIVKAIDLNRVVIIAGETGCGKTTQIPQFILEYCQEKNQACKIICTQPRRLSAISVAERVAFERNEKIGQTFGYQIRLESKVSLQTLLTYCTNGVLLRMLISEDSPLSTITHIIVDEVHERDRFCDFLLIALKDALVKYKSVKIILMSATIDTSIFSKYFNDCPVITVPGKLYDVDIYFLEDVLRITNYMAKQTLNMKSKLLKKTTKNKNKVSTFLSQNESYALNPNQSNMKVLTSNPDITDNKTKLNKVELDSWLIEEIDKAIEDAWLSGGEDRFTHILYLIHSENISVDYQHSKNLVTALMVAAGRGYLDFVQNFIKLGANLNLKSCNDWTAYDWARNMNQVECAELIDTYATYYCAEQNDKSLNVNRISYSVENNMLLDIYHKIFNDENINYDLILQLIIHICLDMPMGSILVFLPGYDDIINLRDKILADEILLKNNNYNIFILHSNTQTSDQKKVFMPSPEGYRKIILSTNIAETSITINDVVYVIDSGRIKEKLFDVISGICSLQCNWISQACAKQRMGRAGRCQKGICYRIYSSNCYNNMQLYPIPEIIRLPLQQLCLYTKHLTSPNTSIAEFLERAIEPPSSFVITNAIQLLKTIDALDPWEDLTKMGKHLLDLPVEPYLGKMLLYATVLKCLDPILIIVCSLSHKDPFIIPSHPQAKEDLLSVRKKFAENSYSDHMAILRAYQMWSTKKTYSQQIAFCRENFLSLPVMEIISKSRSQLLAQLKTSGFIKPKGRGDINYLNSNSKNWSAVKAALTAGLYPNLIQLDNNLKTQKEKKILFHSSSVLKYLSRSLSKNSIQPNKSIENFLPCQWMLYEELLQCGRSCYAKNVTLVNSVTVAIFSGSTRLPADIIRKTKSISDSDSNSEISKSFDEHSILKLDDSIIFEANPEVAELILYLRQKWNALFLRCMEQPFKFIPEIDEQFIKTLISVITNEEKACKLEEQLQCVQKD
jgi:HrpA-like RNA helicase